MHSRARTVLDSRISKSRPIRLFVHRHRMETAERFRSQTRDSRSIANRFAELNEREFDTRAKRRERRRSSKRWIKATFYVQPRGIFALHVAFLLPDFRL